ncbi:MAG: hypothetical protein LBB47_01840, partial [Spirochaetaceae bacterium]|nr:hypothetical protein [Spirochaetaceae bacterium]
MGLHMNEQKAVTRETREEYHKAGKKEKGLILDQYVRLTGYNRKYAVRLLSKPVAGKTVMTVIDGKTVVYKAEKSRALKTDWENLSTHGKRLPASKLCGDFTG